MRLEVHDDRQWANLTAQRWIDFITVHPTARLCLPTGDSPRPVYTSSAAIVDLSEATIFLLDEFDLPPGSAARCDSMLKRDLLDPAARPPKVVHRLNPSALDQNAECNRFDGLVSDGGLDLTLLGLGGNGHLGLNEPGSVADSPTRAVSLAATTTLAVARYGDDAMPTRGMTIGMRRILESDEIWLLVTGSHKAAVLKRMIEGPISSNLPASFLRNHTNATIIADESAAAGL
jgi:6-phosphogluconolactonase/glucosamine-6-phosphate isomerase/deaminase